MTEAAVTPPTPVHARLATLAGDWQGSTSVWFEPGKVGDVSPVAGSIRSVLGGRFIVWEYTGSLGGKPMARRTIASRASCGITRSTSSKPRGASASTASM